MKTVAYKAPNLHAPRTRDIARDFLSYPAKDYYGFFARLKEQHPQLAKYSNQKIALWITAYNKAMAKAVVENRDGVQLPERIGYVVTGICKPTPTTASNNIDFAASKRLGANVHYRNAHTNGYIAKIYYTNNVPRCRFTNHNLWTFKPVRALTRAVSAVMKENAGYTKYPRFTKKYTVSAYYDKTKLARCAKRKEKLQKARAKKLAEYDVFYISED